jgi:glycerol-1-phosphate dehydrogenase [NAD(P)+]
MFAEVASDLRQRAMRPQVRYGHRILGDTLDQLLAAHKADSYAVLTLPDPWAASRLQFEQSGAPTDLVFLESMDHAELERLSVQLSPTQVVVGLGGGQALDAAKYIAWQRHLPLMLAPTIVSADAAVTNTIAVREGRRVRYLGFIVADAIPVDLHIISAAPAELNRAGIGDLLSIHTALWDWQATADDYDPEIARRAATILAELDVRAESIGAISDEALQFIMEAYVRENALCLQVGSSRPEEGSEHYLAYNIEYVTGHGFVHGQLICLCTYAMARLQENRPDWVLALVERSGCPWRLRDLGISHDEFLRALITLPEYAGSEGFPPTVVTERHFTPELAKALAEFCA